METESTGTPTGETRLALVRRARRIDRILAETYPYAVAELDFETPFELLVATVLSAQTTDVRVNAATPALFARFPDAHAMAAATEPELQELVRSTGFYRNKASAILRLSQELVARHDGEVPAREDEPAPDREAIGRALDEADPELLRGQHDTLAAAAAAGGGALLGVAHEGAQLGLELRALAADGAGARHFLGFFQQFLDGQVEAAPLVAAQHLGAAADHHAIVELLRATIPMASQRGGGHPAKRTFQALRIEVNAELAGWARALPVALDRIAVGGRIAVLSFHSLEDRITKRGLAAGAASTAPADLPVELPEHAPELRLLTRGALTPSAHELDTNSRSASVRLRGAERIRPPRHQEGPHR